MGWWIVIELRIATENQKSINIAERVGFTREGIEKDAEFLYDHFLHHVVYAKRNPLIK